MPVEPPGVTTVTEVTLDETVSVVVPPFEVRTLEMTGDDEVGTVSVAPDGVTMVMVLVGTEVESMDETETEVTGTPYSVMIGEVEAGVSTVMVLPDGVVTVTELSDGM